MPAPSGAQGGGAKGGDGGRGRGGKTAKKQTEVVAKLELNLLEGIDAR